MIRSDGRLVATVVRALVLVAIFATARAHAQSVNPPIAIFTGKANGNLVIANPTLFPLSFVLEPFSFTTSRAGDLTFVPLDTARIHLKLSAMSGRIPPRQSMRLFYEAQADSVPSWFVIVASFSRGAPTGGLTVRMQMTQMVYLMQSAPAVESDLTLDAATYDPLKHTVRARIENHSDRLTRLLALKVVSSAGPSYDVEAGPIFPNSVRDFVYVWKRSGRPATLVAEFQGFALTRPITLAVPGAAVPPLR